jgi:HK97 family phage major capsid protein
MPSNIMDPRIVALRKEINDAAQEVKGAFDAEDEERKNNPTYVMPAEKKERVRDLNKGIEEKETRLAEWIEEWNLRSQNDQRMQRFRTDGSVGNGIVHAEPTQERKGGQYEDPETFGSRFVENQEVSAYLKSVAPHGQISEQTRIHTPTVYYTGREAKALVWTGGGTVTSAPSIPRGYLAPQPMQLPFMPYIGPDRLPFDFMALITRGTTTSDLIEYVQELSDWQNNATFVPESQDLTGSQYVKPQSGLGTFLRQSTTVRSIAHWIPATKRALSDVGQLRTMIDQFLTWGIQEKIEEQVLNGDGGGENLLGINNQPGLSLQPFDTNMLITTRKARTRSQVNGWVVPEAYVMHPIDWESIDLTTDGFDRYYFGGPQNVGAPRLWGLPVVETQRVPEGTAYTGSFRTCILWDREAVTIQATDSHADFFVRNLVAILAEARLAFAVLRPREIVKIDLGSGTPPTTTSTTSTT